MADNLAFDLTSLHTFWGLCFSERPCRPNAIRAMPSPYHNQSMLNVFAEDLGVNMNILTDNPEVSYPSIYRVVF